MFHGKVLIINTGGTIDSHAAAVSPVTITPLRESVIPVVLQALGLDRNCDILTWKRKDSKDFTPEEMEALAKLIRDECASSVVILHGTDYMAHNARVMAGFYGRYIPSDVTIAFTGAMVPVANQLEGIGESDGFDNVRYAVEMSRRLAPGVHICFAREVFDPFYTVKNFERKAFERVEDAQEPALLNPPSATGRFR